MQEIKITVNPDFSVTIETTGFKGGACMKETETILKGMEAAGINTTVKDQKKKPEFYAITTDSKINNRM